jgi:hypothetical protein
MVNYSTRIVEFETQNNSEPITFSTNSTTSKRFNNLREYDVTVKESDDSANLIGGSRDKERLVLLHEELEVKASIDLVSLMPFYLALGTYSTNTTTGITTISVSNLPWVQLFRYLNPVEAGEDCTLQVYGAKLDSMDFSLEAGGVATAELTFFGRGFTSSTTSLTANIQGGIEPFAGYDADVKIGGVELGAVSAISLTISNSLARRISIGTDYGYHAYDIAEAGLSVTGKLTLNDKALGKLDNLRTSTSLEITLSKTHGGTASGSITLPNIQFNTYPEKLVGLDPYETELEFKAVPSSTQSKITVTSSTASLF